MWRRRTKNQEPGATDSGSQFSVLGSESSDRLLRRLQWTVLRPLATQLGGDERSLARGTGMELSDVRAYQPGDDIRHIDWNITARADQPFVREAQAERALDVWLLLDLSPSIDWGTARCLKRDRAIEFAAVAGQLLGRRGNRVGAITFADQPLAVIPPANGRMQLQHLIDRVRTTDQPTRRGSTDLVAAIATAQRVIRRRSLVLIVSDFMAPDGWQRLLKQLGQRHEVIAARLHDPREAVLPDIGLATFEDPETGAQVIVNTGDRSVRERFAEAAQAQADQIEADLKSSGADPLVLGTDSELLPTMIRFLNARRVKKGIRQQVSGYR